MVAVAILMLVTSVHFRGLRQQAAFAFVAFLVAAIFINTLFNT
jgi:hypothetical protein